MFPYHRKDEQSNFSRTEETVCHLWIFRAILVCRIKISFGYRQSVILNYEIFVCGQYTLITGHMNWWTESNDFSI